MWSSEQIQGDIIQGDIKQAEGISILSIMKHSSSFKKAWCFTNLDWIICDANAYFKLKCILYWLDFTHMNIHFMHWQPWQAWSEFSCVSSYLTDLKEFFYVLDTCFYSGLGWLDYISFKSIAFVLPVFKITFRCRTHIY